MLFSDLQMIKMYRKSNEDGSTATRFATSVPFNSTLIGGGWLAVSLPWKVSCLHLGVEKSCVRNAGLPSHFSLGDGLHLPEAVCISHGRPQLDIFFFLSPFLIGRTGKASGQRREKHRHQRAGAGCPSRLSTITRWIPAGFLRGELRARHQDLQG